MMTWWQFGFHLLVFLFVNALVAYANFETARHWGQGALTRTEVLVKAIVLSTGQIVITQILFGLSGILTWWPVMALNGLLAIGILVLSKRRSLKHSFRPDVGGEHPHNQVIWGVSLTIGVIMLIHLFQVLGMPPFGTDSVGYHLPIAVEWLQTGRILVENNVPYHYYPGVSELVDLWLLLPFHDPVLVNLQNWPFVLLAGLALYNLARRAGASLRQAVYGILLLLGIRAIQVILMFISFQDNDILIAAFFLAAVNLAIIAVENANRTLLIGEGIALGLLVGVKYSGPGYAALVVAIHVFLAVSQHRAKQLVGNILIVTLVALLLGGFWYIRNWITYGNPIVPMIIQVRGHTVFPGWAPLDSGIFQNSSVLNKITEPGVIEPFINRALLGHGGIATALAIPALLVTTLKWGYEFVILKNQSPLQTTLYVLLPWGAFWLYITTPLATENIPGTLNQLYHGYSPIRFGFLFWSLANLLLAKLLFDNRWRRSWLPDIFVVLMLTHSFVTLLYYQLEFSVPPVSHLGLIMWLGLVAIAAAAEWAWRNTPRRIWHWVATLTAVLAAGFVLWPKYTTGFSAREQLYEYKLPGYAAVQQAVSEHSISRISLVGYDGLFTFSAGEGLTTRVIYCYPPLERWMDCISKNDVELVAFRQEDKAELLPISETVLMTRYAERFAPLLLDDRVHIYLIQR
jgi:hypothetical protein